VLEIDGHDPSAIEAALSGAAAATLPTVIIARTDILGRLRSIPSTVDGHFVKLDGAMQSNIIEELEAACR
jgi:transketolase